MNIYEENVWDKLKKSEKPVVLYGMGDGADKILAIFEQKGIRCADIFASDEFVRGHSFHGIRVKKLSEIEALYGEVCVVLAFATNRDEMIERIFNIAEKHTVLAPDVPVAGITLFTKEFFTLHKEEFEKAYSLLIDDASRQAYERIINFKIGGDIALLKPFFEKERVYSECLKLKGETIVDLGAYDGDTVREFIAADKNYQKIFALEPDEKNFKKLIKNTAGMRDIVPFNFGAWDKEEIGLFSSESSRNSTVSVKGKEVHLTRVDALIKEPITLLKMDIEGSELKAIDGAKNTIQSVKPKLYICAYHRSEDMFALPLKIHEICPDYRFYFAHHKYIPAWESNFYGVAGKF